MLNILIQKRTPVSNEQTMRIIIGSRYSFQLTCSYEFSHQYAGTSLYALTAIVGELHLVLIEVDTVTEDAEYSTRTHDVGVETFLLEVSIERNEK